MHPIEVEFAALKSRVDDHGHRIERLERDSRVLFAHIEEIRQGDTIWQRETTEAIRALLVSVRRLNSNIEIWFESMKAQSVIGATAEALATQAVGVAGLCEILIPHGHVKPDADDEITHEEEIGGER